MFFLLLCIIYCQYIFFPEIFHKPLYYNFQILNKALLYIYISIIVGLKIPHILSVHFNQRYINYFYLVFMNFEHRTRSVILFLSIKLQFQ